MLWWYHDMISQYDDMMTWCYDDMSTTLPNEAVEKNPPEKRSPTIDWKFFRNPRFSPNPIIFWCTALSISLSRAKFDEQADFDIRSAVARPKPCQIGKKQNFRSENFAEKFVRRRKTKRPKSSETRFGKVSQRSEPCSSSYEKISTSILRREIIPQTHMATETNPVKDAD